LGFSASGGPTYLPAIFVLSAKPNKMAEDRTIPRISNIFGKNHERKESIPKGMASKLQIRQQRLFTIFSIHPKKISIVRTNTSVGQAYL
jgi:hypothetical protein